MSLKLVCVNIERSKHLARVEDFLAREEADVVCLQEVAMHDVPRFEKMFGGHFAWAPMCKGVWEESPDLQVMCVGMGSRHGLGDVRVQYYHGTDEPLPTLAFDEARTEFYRDSISHLLLSADVVVAGEAYRIGTTHLTWTKNGASTPEQREDAAALIEAARDDGVGVLCGDFNAPRGRETWAMLAAAFKDNIPPEIGTTLDGSLHRAGPLPYVVDGLFSAKGYAVSGVRVVDGVSDHMGLAAYVARDKR